MAGRVAAVSSNGTYVFSKPDRPSSTLLAGLGVEGDVHAGETIRHQFLPTGTLLHLGAEAVVEVTGLRNPCAKINDFRQGLLGEMFAIDPVSGDFTFRSGVMAVVRHGGPVRPYDAVEVELPPAPHRPLERV
ncbi:MOSC domain-containing protein [Streptomyces sp. NPDC091271]|uniref:MOSC domain-containing protein n=1 Tax=Streptomyces sp. NPDC091271 TaxID=3365980 RepID=UPI00382D198E